MTRNRRSLLLLLLVTGPLSGCGYKGALYLPKSAAGGTKPATVLIPEPAPDRPLPAQAAPAPK